jgi:hypothetical protein
MLKNEQQQEITVRPSPEHPGLSGFTEIPKKLLAYRAVDGGLQFVCL